MVKSTKDFKLGIKFYHPSQFNEFIKPHLDDLDFIEIMALPENDYSFFKDIDKPCVLHNAHSGQGFNLSDITRTKHNFECLDFSLRLAELLDAKHIIVHPGQTVNYSKGEFELMIENLYHFKINYAKGPSMLVENLMHFCDRSLGFPYGFNFNSMKDILAEGKLGFCFDLAHAAVTQLQTNNPLFPALAEYFLLKPKHYHASDLLQSKRIDQHAHLGDGDLPYDKLIPLIPNNSWITLETDIREPEKIASDILFFRDQKSA